jgi:hypothetical protein
MQSIAQAFFLYMLHLSSDYTNYVHMKLLPYRRLQTCFARNEKNIYSL